MLGFIPPFYYLSELQYLGAALRTKPLSTPLGKERELVTFERALEALKQGSKVAREGWNGKGLWIEAQRPDEHSKMTRPYLYINIPGDIETPLGSRVPWLPSQTDIFAEDWYIY